MAKAPAIKVLRNVTEIVQALGGTAAAARWAGTNMPAISRWKSRGFVPPGWDRRLIIDMASRGFLVHPTVFGGEHNGTRADIFLVPAPAAEARKLLRRVA